MSKQSQKMYIKNLTIYEFNMDKIMEFWYSRNEGMIKKYKYLIMLGTTSKELEELVGDDQRVEEYKKSFDEVTVSIGINDWIDEETDQRMIRNNIEKEARKEGLEEGIKKGIEQNQRDMIINLNNLGTSIEVISQASNLSIEEVQKIIDCDSEIRE